jgi:hypothetical protein
MSILLSSIFCCGSMQIRVRFVSDSCQIHLSFKLDIGFLLRSLQGYLLCWCVPLYVCMSMHVCVCVCVPVCMCACMYVCLCPSVPVPVPVSVSVSVSVSVCLLVLNGTTRRDQFVAILDYSDLAPLKRQSSAQCRLLPQAFRTQMKNPRQTLKSLLITARKASRMTS